MIGDRPVKSYWTMCNNCKRRVWANDIQTAEGVVTKVIVCPECDR